MGWDCRASSLEGKDFQSQKGKRPQLRENCRAAPSEGGMLFRRTNHLGRPAWRESGDWKKGRAQSHENNSPPASKGKEVRRGSLEE